MASGDDRATPIALDASQLRIGLVASRWNQEIIDRLVGGAQRAFAEHKTGKVIEVSAPGAYELPFAAQTLARSGQVDGIVVVGAVIRGETTHYELVAGECGRAIMDVQLATDVPIGFGVLTVENRDQALARSEEAGGHNVGEEAAAATIEMVLLRRRFPSP